jgi:hypothetical protein
MKYLRVLLALAMLFCGFSGHARADIDFRATVLDGPNDCATDNTGCFIHDPTEQLTVALSTDACPAGVNTGDSGTPYGCFVGDNLTGLTITGLTLTFAGAPLGNQDASCDSAGQNGVPSVFDVISCGDVDGTYLLKFAGGTGVPTGTDFVIFEEGADPALFEDGTGTLTVATPEPDSVVLISTGVMMAGLFAFWQRRRVSFGAGRV